MCLCLAAPIGTLRATDPDGDPLTYSTPSAYFTVNSITGVVRLKAPLDREVNLNLNFIYNSTGWTFSFQSSSPGES